MGTILTFYWNGNEQLITWSLVQLDQCAFLSLGYSIWALIMGRTILCSTWNFLSMIFFIVKICSFV